MAEAKRLKRHGAPASAGERVEVLERRLAQLEALLKRDRPGEWQR